MVERTNKRRTAVIRDAQELENNLDPIQDKFVETRRGNEESETKIK